MQSLKYQLYISAICHICSVEENCMHNIRILAVSAVPSAIWAEENRASLLSYSLYLNTYKISPTLLSRSPKKINALFIYRTIRQWCNYRDRPLLGYQIIGMGHHIIQVSCTSISHICVSSHNRASNWHFFQQDNARTHTARVSQCMGKNVLPDAIRNLYASTSVCRMSCTYHWAGSWVIARVYQ